MDKWEVEGALGVDMTTGERGNYAIRIGNLRLVPFNGRLLRKEAYLIAAAPALLAACEAAETYLKPKYGVDQDVCDMVEAAIKLAKEGNSGG